MKHSGVFIPALEYAIKMEDALRVKSSTLPALPATGAADGVYNDCLYAIIEREDQLRYLHALRLSLAIMLYANPVDMSHGDREEAFLRALRYSDTMHMTIAYGVNRYVGEVKEVVEPGELLKQYPQLSAFVDVTHSKLDIRGIRYFPNADRDVVVLSVTPTARLIALKQALFDAHPHLGENLAQAHASRVAAGDDDDVSLSAPCHPDTWHITLGAVKKGCGATAVRFLCDLTALPVAGFRELEVAKAPKVPPAFLEGLVEIIDDCNVTVVGIVKGRRVSTLSQLNINAIAVCTAISDTVVDISTCKCSAAASISLTNMRKRLKQSYKRQVEIVERSFFSQFRDTRDADADADAEAEAESESSTPTKKLRGMSAE